MSVLAGILIPIGFGVVDYKGLRHLRQVPRADAAVLLAVLVVTIFGSLIQAVGIGIVLASVLYMKQSSDLSEAQTSVDLVEMTEAGGVDIAEMPLNGPRHGKVYSKHLYGPMFFGFTSHFQELVRGLDKDIDALIIRMNRAPYIDQPGLYAMEDAILDLRQNGIVVLLAGIDTQPLDMLRRIGIVPALVSEAQIFDTFEEGIAWVDAHLSRPHTPETGSNLRPVPATAKA